MEANLLNIFDKVVPESFVLRVRVVIKRPGNAICSRKKIDRTNR